MLRFLEGRALKVFLSPGGLAARFLGRGTGLVFAIFARVTGVDMLGELSTFFRSLSGVIDGFGERIRGVAELLRDPETSFLIVTSPEHEPAREALFLAEQLRDERMGCDATIVNRVHLHGLDGHSAEEVAGSCSRPSSVRRSRGARRITSPTSTCSRGATATRSPVCVASSTSPPRDRAASRRGHPGPRGPRPDRGLSLRLRRRLRPAARSA